MNQFIKKSLKFILLSAGIYACYITSGVFHEKLLKKPYKHKITGQQAYFNSILFFGIMPQLFATLSGKIILLFQEHVQKQTITYIPYKKVIICGLIINLNLLTYNDAVIETSFSSIVMAKSCSLLSVIIVGVFCSKVKQKKLQLSYQKIFVGLLATLGIVLFNFYKQQESQNNSDHALKIWSLGSLLLLMSLIGDGFLPDFQAQIKSQYKPSSVLMYYSINKITFIIAFILSILSKQIFHIYTFLSQYQNFLQQSLIFAFLNGTGQLFIYKMIKQFRQHIPAFVIAFRKCLTVIVNIIFFHHTINIQQILGISLVFLAVFWEVWSNNRKQKPQNTKNYYDLSDQKGQLTKSVSMDIDETDRILKSIEEQLEQAQNENNQQQGRIIGA